MLLVQLLISADGAGVLNLGADGVAGGGADADELLDGCLLVVNA
jgi:hypothetical protein